VCQGWSGRSCAGIGERVGQRSRIVTADRYTHALLDYGEVDRAKLLTRVVLGAAVSSQPA
jgi:hypothetical protein